MTRRGEGGACNGCGESASDGCPHHCLFTEIDAALTPPADQPAPATRSPLGKPFNPGIVIDDTPRLIQPPKIGEGSLPKPAPATKACPRCNGTKWQGGCIGSEFAPCKLCRDVNGEPTGRVPAEGADQ